MYLTVSFKAIPCGIAVKKMQQLDYIFSEHGHAYVGLANLVPNDLPRQPLSAHCSHWCNEGMMFLLHSAIHASQLCLLPICVPCKHTALLPQAPPLPKRQMLILYSLL